MVVISSEAALPVPIGALVCFQCANAMKQLEASDDIVVVKSLIGVDKKKCEYAVASPMRAFFGK